MSDLTKPDAEEFSQTLEQIGEGWFRQLALGLRLGVPEALGLTRRQWSDRIGVTVRSAAERRGAVTELSAEGLSSRAIADVLGVDDRTVRRDLAVPKSAANAAPGDKSQGGEPMVSAANAALAALAGLAEGTAIILAEPDIPEGAKDAAVLIESTVRFYYPYRFGGRKVGEYERRKLTKDLGDIITLMWAERSYFRQVIPKKFDEIEQSWRSRGILDEAQP
jgi:hypothetical protein